MTKWTLCITAAALACGAHQATASAAAPPTAAPTAAQTTTTEPAKTALFWPCSTSYGYGGYGSYYRPACSTSYSTGYGYGAGYGSGYGAGYGGGYGSYYAPASYSQPIVTYPAQPYGTVAPVNYAPANYAPVNYGPVNPYPGQYGPSYYPTGYPASYPVGQPYGQPYGAPYGQPYGQPAWPYWSTEKPQKGPLDGPIAKVPVTNISRQASSPADDPFYP